jgi:tetratricopeptide (TPR) repeat protein
VSTATLACDGQGSTPKAAPPQTATVANPGPGTPAADAADADAAEKHYQSALALEAAGRYVEARTEVDLAISGGAGKDAKLLAAKLAILRDDLDAARRLLEPLADSNDALVLYNLGLVAQRTGAYNEARTRYLAALKVDPNYAAIRFNLAVLTWDAGVKDEAQHHARKFLEMSPGDPNGAELRRKVELDGPPAADTQTEAKADSKTEGKADSKALKKPAAPR